MLNPIITIKAWRRPNYLKQVLDRLLIQNEIKSIPIFVSIDYNQDTDQEIKTLLSNYNDLTVVYQEQNIGCAGNMKACSDYAFEQADYNYMIHLEDDIIVSGDFLKWMLWAGEYLSTHEDIFAACAGKCKEAAHQSVSNTKDTYLNKFFECRFGFGMTREIYKGIKELGGIRGFKCNNKNKNPEINEDVHPKYKEFLIKNKARDDMKGTWARSFNYFFRNDRFCLYPYISRTNNIGAESGKFNPSATWHEEHVKLTDWIDNYKDSVSSYNLPNLRHE